MKYKEKSKIMILCLIVLNLFKVIKDILVAFTKNQDTIREGTNEIRISGYKNSAI